MENIRTFIESGILETYVLGNSTPQETDLVDQMANSFKEVRAEIDAISEALEFYALSHPVAPNPHTRVFLLANIDFTERMKRGEQPSFPAELNSQSTPGDYTAWTEREDMVLPVNFTDIHAKIIGYTPTMISAIVWIRDMAPDEVHHDEYEKFLVLEGSCEVWVEGELFMYGPGDYFSIPLHKQHRVAVTSIVPCKVILQRIAA